MSWRVLYVEESELLSLYLDNFKVKKGTSELIFPLADISLVLIDNYKLNITVNLINACAKKNIPIVFCGDNHHPFSILTPIHSHFECTKVLFEQLKWREEEKGQIWQTIVKQKIKNQLFVLRQCKNDTESIGILTKYIDEVDFYDKTNREGLAAKVYFRSLFGKEFSRHDSDAINACLDYGYSVVRAMISKTLIAKGLNTQLGIFHKGPTNSFNLSDDVIELFRPVVDLFVYNNFLNEKIFVREHRLKILEIINMKLEIDFQKLTLNHAIEKVVDDLIKYFKEGVVGKSFDFEPVLYDL